MTIALAWVFHTASSYSDLNLLQGHRQQTESIQKLYKILPITRNPTVAKIADHTGCQ